MSNAATRLDNQLFQEDWMPSTTTENQKKKEAKISYLMVEKVTPPDNLWEKISKKLDQQDQALQQSNAPAYLSKKALAWMIAVAAASIAAVSYWFI